MLLLIIAFIIFVIVGLYTDELNGKAAIVYIALVMLGCFIVFFMDWNIAVWFVMLGFIDAILLIHVFKGDLVIKRR